MGLTNQKETTGYFELPIVAVRASPRPPLSLTPLFCLAFLLCSPRASPPLRDPLCLVSAEAASRPRFSCGASPPALATLSRVSSDADTRPLLLCRCCWDFCNFASSQCNCCFGNI